MKLPSIKDVRQHLIAKPGKKFSLSDRDSGDRQIFDDKEDAETSLAMDAAAINELQDMLYAVRKHSVLVILQGMDTAGKSGTIRKVFADTSPLGMEVAAFKAPSKNELARDYLWRVHQVVPRKGFIGIFDRSHYEDVLVVKVREFADPDTIEERYAQINAFEKLLVESGTVIVKCMLHVGYEEQGIRLRERLEEPHKLWKFNPADLEDRKLWPDFMSAYETAVERCSTEHAPWYIVPSDSRTRRNAMVARLVRGALEDLDLEWPKPGHDKKAFQFD